MANIFSKYFGKKLSRVGKKMSRHKTENTDAEQKTRNTGCFAILGRCVDTGANLGKQGVGDEIFVSRPRFARLGYFSAYSVVHFS